MTIHLPASSSSPSSSSSSSPNLPFSLLSLRAHSIFIPPPNSTSLPLSYSDDGWEVVDRPGSTSTVTLAKSSSVSGSQSSTSNMIALRDKDLLVAFGKEVRMTCLSGEGWEVKGNSVGTYRTLKSPHLTFDVRRLLVNPNGRLLAIIGDRQICVLLLPRSGTSTGDITCRSFPIDEFNLSPSSTVSISKALWHPLGENGNSLWVLTADGKLSEYDILRPSDPTQIFDFLPSKPKTSSSRFTAVDPLSQYAVSFAFGPDATKDSPTTQNGASPPFSTPSSSTDFSLMTAYVLMANGDIYAMSPILPLRSHLSAHYLQSLRARCVAKQRSLEDQLESGQDGIAEHAAQAGRVSMQSSWLDAVIKQVKVGMDSGSNASPRSISTPTRRGFGLHGSVLGKEKDKGSEEINNGSETAMRTEGWFKVHPPHLTETGGPAPGVHRSVLRQGPALFDPAPIEATIDPNTVDDDEEEEEPSATDLLIISHSGLTILLIAWTPGRVDVIVDLHGVDPRWVSWSDPSPPTWSLSTIESIVLPKTSMGNISPRSALALIVDPIHSGVVYVQRGEQVDAISIIPVIESLLSGTESGNSEVTRLVDSTSSKPVSIVGVVTFCNISLGYGLLALASTGQLAAVEFDFRVGTGMSTSSMEPPSDHPTSTATDTATHTAATDDTTSTSTTASVFDDHSLLSKSLNFDSLLASITSPSSTSEILSKVRRLPDSRQPLYSITPDHLRAVAESASLVRARIEKIRHASEIIERRVDVQVAEAQRQVQKVKDARSRLEVLKKSSNVSSSGEGRVEALAKRYEEMGERLDKVLSAMMAEYRPQIGEVEKKWFDELERLKFRVYGVGAAGRNGLNHRVQVLKEQLAVVKNLAEKKNDIDEAEDGNLPGEYGQKQLRPLQVALSTRSDELAKMMRKVESLHVKVDAVDDD